MKSWLFMIEKLLDGKLEFGSNRIGKVDTGQNLEFIYTVEN